VVAVTAAPAAAGRVLGRTLASAFEPGTNLRGEAVGGAWTLLLDDLALGNVVCVGRPPAPTLRTLAARARNVSVVGDAEAVPAADLVVLTGRAAVRRARRDPAIARAAVVYADRGGLGGERLWVRGGAAEVHLAAGRDDRAAIATLRARFTAPLRRRVRPRALIDAARVRRASLVRATPPAAGGLPVPEWLSEAAARAGVDLDGCRVALAAPCDYPSRKAVVFVFAPGAAAPHLVVKLTRDANFNDRLENEWRALRRLAATPVPAAGAAPEAAFLGHPAGLAALGQSAVDGTPFRRCTSATVDCPHARAATGWLLALGAATAEGAPAADAGAALGALLGRYAAIYRPSANEHDALAAAIGAIAASRDPFPLVMQHGDAGTWNLLVTPDGRPAFLDWEASEAAGMPLWDLFYFARSFAVTVARAGGVRDSLRAFDEQVAGGAALGRMVAEDVAGHAARIGLDPALVEPLLLTCWMHRALKEATRLRVSALPRGRYAALLRLCVARRDAPGLRAVCQRRR
jgi:aminoglycoside phosphotransferase (APT) family kinase protein